MVLFFATFIFVCYNFAKDEKGAVTQGEFAKILTEKMDLKVPEGTGANGYIKALDQRGISPSDGWNADKPVTTKDLSNIFVGAGRLQAGVAAGKDPQSVLKEVGVIVPGEINNKTVNAMFEDQNIQRLLNATVMAGASIPYPSHEKEEEGVQIKPTPPAETPPAPAVQEEVKPSSGGGT